MAAKKVKKKATPKKQLQALLAIKIADQLCLEFDFTGHPYCPCCNNEIHKEEDHNPHCLLGNYYKEYH